MVEMTPGEGMQGQQLKSRRMPTTASPEEMRPASTKEGGRAPPRKAEELTRRRAAVPYTLASLRPAGLGRAHNQLALSSLWTVSPTDSMLWVSTRLSYSFPFASFIIVSVPSVLGATFCPTTTYWERLAMAC